MEVSLRSVERLANIANLPVVELRSVDDGCRAILQALSQRPADEWQCLYLLSVGALHDVERLIAARAIEFSRTEHDCRSVTDSCRCCAKLLPDGSMGWFRADGEPCDCPKSTAPPDVCAVPIASVRLTVIGRALLDRHLSGDASELVDELLRGVDALQSRQFQEDDPDWLAILELDARIAIAAQQQFPNVPLATDESAGFCRIPVSRTMDGTCLMTESGYIATAGQWRHAMRVLRRMLCDAKRGRDKSGQPKIVLPSDQAVSDVWNRVQDGELESKSLIAICREVAGNYPATNPDTLRRNYDRWRSKSGL